MNRFRSKHARFMLVALMAATVASACVVWQDTEMSPSQAVAEKNRVLLTTSDGDRIMIADPMISDGQIVGHPVRGLSVFKSDTVRVSVDSVVYVEVRNADAFGTLVGLLVGLGAVGVLVYYATLSAFHF